MNLHNFTVYNKTVFYSGAIMLSIGTYLDNTKKVDNPYIIWVLLSSSILLMVLGFKKPKENKSNEA